jgi:glycosyltransferase involved in cell wall biosynthesis
MTPLVLYVLDSLQVGGTETSVSLLARTMRSFRAAVCTVYRDNTLAAGLTDAGIRVVSLDVAQRWGLFEAANRLERLVATMQPALVHTGLLRASVVSRVVARRRRVPLVDSIVSDSYGDARMQRFDTRTRMRMRAVQMLDASTAPLVGHWVANSHATAARAVEQLTIDPARITVIPRGRDLSRFRRDDTVRASLRPTLVRHASQVLLMSVGRLIDEKGHALAITALAQVRASGIDARLVLVGDGPRRGRLEACAIAAGVRDDVVFLGTRHDVPALLSAADAFVFPSYLEGMPGALLEAMAAGLACIVSDVDVHREVDDASGALRFFDVGSADALAAQLIAVFADDNVRQRGATAAARRASRFDVASMVDAHEQLYERVLAQ